MTIFLFGLQHMVKTCFLFVSEEHSLFVYIYKMLVVLLLLINKYTGRIRHFWVPVYVSPWECRTFTWNPCTNTRVSFRIFSTKLPNLFLLRASPSAISCVLNPSLLANISTPVSVHCHQGVLTLAPLPVW